VEQMILGFAQRAFGDVEEVREFWRVVAQEPFRDVARHGARRLPNLFSEFTIDSGRPRFREGVHIIADQHRELPDDEILEPTRDLDDSDRAGAMPRIIPSEFRPWPPASSSAFNIRLSTVLFFLRSARFGACLQPRATIAYSIRDSGTQNLVEPRRTL
jgi:hypothetical protein